MRLRHVRFAPTLDGCSRANTNVGARSRVVQLVVLVVGALSSVACGKTIDVVAEGLLSRGGGGSGSSGGSGGSGGVTAGGPSNPPIECDGSYPVVAWADAGGAERTLCTAGFARDRMSYALCSCGNLDTFGGVYSNAFDSVTPDSPEAAAAVGINGECHSTAPLAIEGSLTIAAPTELLLPGLEVHGDVRLGGELTVSGPMYVTRDAWFAESVVSLSIASVRRDVHQRPGKTFDASVPALVGGQTFAEEFSIAPPCRCDSAAALDWSSVLASASTQNDNELIDLDALALATAPDAVDLTLPCGRFYVTEITGDREIHLRVTGRVALFVGGEVSSSGPLDVELGPDAELDWFVGGALDLSNAIRVGDAARPAAVRIYVAGAGELPVPREFVFANLYAPLSDVVLTGSGDFYGSLFGQTLTSAAAITVHYDAAVHRAGEACRDADPASCSGCGQCEGGRTCLAGSCADCVNDQDCCSPLVCEGGRCVALRQ